MHTAIYPGSFDPITRGHVDIIERAALLADTLLVVVMRNVNKKGLFSVEERIGLIQAACAHIPNVKVCEFSGLLIDCARTFEAQAVVRGLRSATDFEYELQMAQTNHATNPSVDTIFLTTNLKYAYLSSSIVKEVAMYGGDISKFVAPSVMSKVYEKYGIEK